MFKKIQERIFPFIIATSALSVSASAAFYSVSGLSKLFAGASFEVMVMAGSLEVAKLVIASLLYQYWDKLNKLLKTYLTIAATVLILITSMGIYGFLSAAYQETANKAGNLDAQIALVETKRDNVRDQLAVYNAEKSTINGAVSDLRSGLSNNKIQYRDKETGQIITTTSSSTRRALEKQLDQAIERQTEINSKVDELNEQLFNYETEIVEIKTGNDLAGELGPLKYLSGLTDIPMDQIINYLLLVIIFVFDPLAIALVVVANFAFEQAKVQTEERKQKKLKEDMLKGAPVMVDPETGRLFYYEETPEEIEKIREKLEKAEKSGFVEEDKGATIEEQAFGTDWEDESMWTEEEMEDFNNQFNADDMLPDEENQLEFDFNKVEEVEEEFDEADINKDGVVDDAESRLQSQINEVLNSGMSTYRKNKIIEELKRQFSANIYNQDDNQITYN